MVAGERTAVQITVIYYTHQSKSSSSAPAPHFVRWNNKLQHQQQNLDYKICNFSLHISSDLTTIIFNMHRIQLFSILRISFFLGKTKRTSREKKAAAEAAKKCLVEYIFISSI